jgi:hypothetical protein
VVHARHQPECDTPVGTVFPEYLSINDPLKYGLALGRGSGSVDALSFDCLQPQYGMQIGLFTKDGRSLKLRPAFAHLGRSFTNTTRFSPSLLTSVHTKETVIKIHGGRRTCNLLTKNGTPLTLAQIFETGGVGSSEDLMLCLRLRFARHGELTTIGPVLVPVKMRPAN